MTIHLNKFESPLPKDTLCHVWLKLTQWFWRRFLNIFNIIFLFCYYLPLDKGVALHLNKLESTSSKDIYAKFWWNSPVVLEKKIFKYFQYNCNISLLSPLGEGRGPLFEQTWIPSTQGCFVRCLVEIGRVVLEKKLKLWKVYRRTDRQSDRQTTDNRRSEKLTWAFSSAILGWRWTCGHQLSMKLNSIVLDLIGKRSILTPE